MYYMKTICIKCTSGAFGYPKQKKVKRANFVMSTKEVKYVNQAPKAEFCIYYSFSKNDVIT